MVRPGIGPNLVCMEHWEAIKPEVIGKYIIHCFSTLILATLTLIRWSFLVNMSMIKGLNTNFEYFLCLWTSKSGEKAIFGAFFHPLVASI